MKDENDAWFGSDTPKKSINELMWDYRNKLIAGGWRFNEANDEAYRYRKEIVENALNLEHDAKREDTLREQSVKEYIDAIGKDDCAEIVPATRWRGIPIEGLCRAVADNGGAFPTSDGAGAYQHPIQSVFDSVIEQIVSGKGAQRHGHGAPFFEQPWKQLADEHGIGFLTGQAAKKLGEAQRPHWLEDSILDEDAWEKEMLGAIAYAAMAVLYNRGV